jgi:hypothetical protein
MVKSYSAFAHNLKRSLIGISFAFAWLAAFGVNAQPNTNSVAIYEVTWGPGCSTFAVTSSVNDAGNIKDISNIVLVCGADGEGSVTWDKWEFGSPYVFGTALPGGLVPSEGNGCTGAIRTAYVKAGSFRSGKGIPGVDRKQFNGHVGGKIDCDGLGGN